MIQHIKILSLFFSKHAPNSFCLQVVILFLKNRQNREKKVSLLFCFVILSVQLFLLKLSEEKAALGTSLSSLQHPQKGFDAQVGGLKTHWLSPWFLALGGLSRARNGKRCRKKMGKEKERNMKEEIVRERDRKKGAMLATHQFRAHSCGGAIC